MKKLTFDIGGKAFTANLIKSKSGSWAAGVTSGGIWCGEMKCPPGGEFKLTSSNGGISLDQAVEIAAALVVAVAPPEKKKRKKKEEEAPAEPAAEAPAPEE